jgi:cob(I)alamin adenosyltransferase
VKIYTRTGDDGTTGLLNGERAAKDCLRVEAYGCVDELNSALGLARSLGNSVTFGEIILDMQKLLILVMAELAGSTNNAPAYITVKHVQKIEELMDQLNAALPPLHSFVIPGGSPGSAALDLARTVCRRAERQIWRLAGQESIGKPLLIFMNRLSDLCFLLSRMVDEVTADK